MQIATTIYVDYSRPRYIRATNTRRGRCRPSSSKQSPSQATLYPILASPPCEGADSRAGIALSHPFIFRQLPSISRIGRQSRPLAPQPLAPARPRCILPSMTMRPLRACIAPLLRRSAPASLPVAVPSCRSPFPSSQTSRVPVFPFPKSLIYGPQKHETLETLGAAGLKNAASIARTAATGPDNQGAQIGSAQIAYFGRLRRPSPKPRFCRPPGETPPGCNPVWAVVSCPP